MVARLLIALACAMLPGLAVSAESQTTRFWNLTGETVTHLYLAPAGSGKWGPDQCRNDPDGTVDFDERLAIRDVPAGVYDAKFTDTTGRTCTVQNIEVKPGAIFSIQERDLKSCENR